MKLFHCPKCERDLPSTEFTLTSGICRRCQEVRAVEKKAEEAQRIAAEASTDRMKQLRRLAKASLERRFGPLPKAEKPKPKPVVAAPSMARNGRYQYTRRTPNGQRRNYDGGPPMAQPSQAALRKPPAVKVLVHELVACPTCREDAGFMCHTDKGKPRRNSHPYRIRDAWPHVGPNEVLFDLTPWGVRNRVNEHDLAAPRHGTKAALKHMKDNP